MGLLSFFKRGTPPPAAKSVSDSVDAVQQLRLRARHRLIGAAVLVGLGVIGFPLLFETQPRPIPVDLPIEIPGKDQVAALKVPAPLPSAPAQQLPALPAAETESQAPAKQAEPMAEPAQAPTQAPVSTPALEASKALAATAAAAKLAEKTTEKAPVKVAEAKPEVKAESKPSTQAAKAAEKPAEKIAEKTADKTADKVAERSKINGQEAARVQSLLDGKPSDARASDAGGRLVVQVGAYADSKAAQEVRLKVEKLGLKTYTQVAKTPAGDRIRVRIGPFANRDEADKAAARIRAAGLSTAVLTL